MDIDVFMGAIAYGLDEAKKELSTEDYKNLLVQAQLYLMTLTSEVMPNFDDFISKAAGYCEEWSYEDKADF